MSITIHGTYTGKKFVELLHEPSGMKITTDAPKDNQGDGSSFSPTDLVAASLGSCMLTIMANVCARSGLDLSGATFRVEKHMITEGVRRIGSLPLVFHLPASFSPDDRSKLERAAMTCPVHHSLHPDIKMPIEFLYDV